VEGVVLDAGHPSPPEARERVVALRRTHPRLALIGFTERATAEEHYQLGASGLEGLISSADGGMATRSSVDRALARARGREIARLLEPHLCPPAPEAVGWSVSHATSSPSVDRLARGMGKSLHGLRAELRKRALPPPAELVRWGRLLAAAARLHHDRRTVEETAFAVGYTSTPSLARATRGRVGLTPRQLGELGPGRVLEIFLDETTARSTREPIEPKPAPSP
jgi:AraC-like DNA-binding protein